MKHLPDNQIKLLIEKCFDGSIESSEFQQLDQLLSKDEYARQLYYEFVKMDLILQQCIMEQNDEQQVIGEDLRASLLLFDAVKQDDKLREKLRAKQAGQIKLAAELQLREFLDQHDQVALKPSCVSHKVSLSFNFSIYVKALAACLFVAICLLIYLKPVFRSPVAKIIESHQAQWQQEGVLDRLSLEKAKPYSLKQGWVAIEFKDGAKVVLEAPADIEFLSTNSACLVQGRLTANVPPEAKGFTVETPATRVVDLGTEFSVFVDQAGHSDIHVSKGAITLHPLKSRPEGHIEETVNAYQAKRIEKNSPHIQTIEYDHKIFTQVRSKSLKTFVKLDRSLTAYEKAMYRSDPTCYYSFNEPLLYEMHGNANIIPVVDETYQVAFQNSLHVDGDESYVVAKGAPRLQPVKTATFSTWFKNSSDKRKESMLSVLSSESYSKNKEQEFELFLDIENQLVFAFNDYSATSKARVNEISSLINIQPDRWYYIVVTYEQDRVVSLYINGIKNSQIKLTSSAIFELGQTIYFGTHHDDINDIDDASNFFKGQIDEFAFYHRALSEQEIMEIYQSAMQ